MIKLKDLLPEISSNTTTYANADGGEPDTGFTMPGKDRVLGVDIFPVIHQKSNKKIYVSLEDIDD